ncbi:arsenic resistance protein [Pontibacter rugosus]
MDKINKFQTFVILLAVALGLLLGHLEFLSGIAAGFIVPLLMVMLYGLFLTMNLSELKSSFLNVRFSLASIAINFIWTPLFAYFLGYLFLGNELAIWMGFVMLTVTPCTDWYLVFTGAAKGNVSLSTAILPVNLILQVVLLPVYLLLFFGKSGDVEPSSIVESILLVLLVPFALAFITKKMVGKSSASGERFTVFLKNHRCCFSHWQLSPCLLRKAKT